jgi:hypothetical protein
MAEYYFPNANVGFRSVAPLMASGSDYVLYDCIRNARDVFSLGGASSVTAYGTAGMGITGFSGATVDASGNPWTCQYLGAYQGPGVSGQITAAGGNDGDCVWPLFASLFRAKLRGALCRVGRYGVSDRLVFSIGPLLRLGRVWRDSVHDRQWQSIPCQHRHVERVVRHGD